MPRRLSPASAAALLLVAVASHAALAQDRARPSASPAPTPGPQNQSIINTTKSNVKEHHRVAPAGESGGGKGWDGKVQGKVLVTPVTVSFDNRADYDNFAAGRLKLNLILKNTLSGQTIMFDAGQLAASHRYQFVKREFDAGNRLAINVIVDNMSAPLSEAACGVVSPAAESAGEGVVDVTLSYGACGGGAAQAVAKTAPAKKGEYTHAGIPFGGIIVQGGKGPRGNLRIEVGDSRVMTREEEAQMAQRAGVMPATASKGAGSPKNAGF